MVTQKSLKSTQYNKVTLLVTHDNERKQQKTLVITVQQTERKRCQIIKTCPPTEEEETILNISRGLLIQYLRIIQM